MGKASEVYPRSRAADMLSGARAQACIGIRQVEKGAPSGTLLAGMRSVSCAQVRRSGMQAAGRAGGWGLDEKPG
jgi:hypothetical protein